MLPLQGLQVQSLVGELRSHICCYSLAKSHLTLCNPMNCSTPGLLVLLCPLGFAQTHVLWVSDAIQPSHPLLLPSPTCCATKKKKKKRRRRKKESKQRVIGLTVNLALQMLQWIPLTCLALDISRQLVPPLTLFQGWKSSCAPYRFPEGPGSQSVPMLPTCVCGTLEILLVQPRI